MELSEAEEAVRAGAVELRCDPHDEADTYAMLPERMPQFWAEGRCASCPVVILAGDDRASTGRPLLASILPQIAASLPSGTFERYSTAPVTPPPLFEMT